jgi:hypothetical protein
VIDRSYRRLDRWSRAGTSTKGMNGNVVVTLSCRGPHSACRAACPQSSCVSATRKGIASCWEAVHHFHLRKRIGLLSSLSSGPSRGHLPKTPGSSAISRWLNRRSERPKQARVPYGSRRRHEPVTITGEPDAWLLGLASAADYQLAGRRGRAGAHNAGDRSAEVRARVGEAFGPSAPGAGPPRTMWLAHDGPG